MIVQDNLKNSRTDFYAIIFSWCNYKSQKQKAQIEMLQKKEGAKEINSIALKSQ